MGFQDTLQIMDPNIEKRMIMLIFFYMCKSWHPLLERNKKWL